MHDIELNRVTKSFGDLLAVDDVSAVAAPEEVGGSRRPANSDRFATRRDRATAPGLRLVVSERPVPTGLARWREAMSAPAPARVTAYRA